VRWNKKDEFIIESNKRLFCSIPEDSVFYQSWREQAEKLLAEKKPEIDLDEILKVPDGDLGGLAGCRF
jgi:hypothetical protein